jgi:4-amino-4-deoxy-L-arabinose transferase-like glycosyltransferase
MPIRNIAIIIIFGLGAIAAAIGLYRYFLEAFRQRSAVPMTAVAMPGRASANWIYLAILFVIVIAAMLLRLEGIDLRGMSHVEVYIPGINLPPFAEPPPRLDFMRFLYWHWHDEPHPQGYYLLMYFWTKLFGTSLESIRLPSVIFGTGAVILVYVFTSMACDRRVGLIAAALLAFNGHHIYWSQSARMYSMVCFLGLASAILLLNLLRQPRRRPGLEAGYVLVTFLGLFTQLFFWVLLAAQMLIALVYSRVDGKGVSRVLSLQVTAAIVGSPLWAHAVYRSREIDLGGPTWSFIQDFLNFGFLYLPDYFTSDLPRDVAPGIELAVTAIALVCLLGGLLSRSFMLALDPPVEPASTWKRLLPVAAGFALIIVALAITAWRRQTAIAITALVPLVALSVLPVTAFLWPRMAGALGRHSAWKPFANNGVTFILLLGAVPALLLILVSMFKTMMIARGFLLFVPYLLVVQAVGVEVITRKRLLAIPLLVILAAIHLYSVDFNRKIPGPTGYRELAQQMIERMEADDLVFVYPNDWVTTPLYYYFQEQQGRFIHRDYVMALETHPASRVWVPGFAGYKEPSAAMRAALQGYRIIDHISAHGCGADLYATARSPKG